METEILTQWFNEESGNHWIVVEDAIGKFLHKGKRVALLAVSGDVDNTFVLKWVVDPCWTTEEEESALSVLGVAAR